MEMLRRWINALNGGSIENTDKLNRKITRV